jgi:hypothetical protein
MTLYSDMAFRCILDLERGQQTESLGITSSSRLRSTSRPRKSTNLWKPSARVLTRYSPQTRSDGSSICRRRLVLPACSLMYYICLDRKTSQSSKSMFPSHKPFSFPSLGHSVMICIERKDRKSCSSAVPVIRRAHSKVVKTGRPSAAEQCQTE